MQHGIDDTAGQPHMGMSAVGVIEWRKERLLTSRSVFAARDAIRPPDCSRYYAARCVSPSLGAVGQIDTLAGVTDHRRRVDFTQHQHLSVVRV